MTARAGVAARRFPWWGRIALAIAVFCAALAAGGRDAPRPVAHPIDELRVAVEAKIDHAPTLAPHVPLARTLTRNAGSAALGALTAVLFLALCLELGARPTAAALATLALAFATPIFVYARGPWVELARAAAVTAFGLQLLVTAARPAPPRHLLLGLLGGGTIAADPIFAAALPGAAAFLVWRTSQALGGRRAALLGGLGAVGLLPGAWLAWRTGALARLAGDMDGALFDGAVGLLFSPGKSAFLCVPPLILAAFALPLAWRRARTAVVAAALSVTPVAICLATRTSWSDAGRWGPHVLVPLVPVMLAPLALLLDDVLAAAPSWRRGAVLGATAAAFAAGVSVQTLGSAFSPAHFARVATDAKIRWLGPARQAGTPAAPPDRSPRFEISHATTWLPPLSPLAGHAWMWRHARSDGTMSRWELAEADAPWRRHTTLKLDLAASWQPARVDWWRLDFAGPYDSRGHAILRNTIVTGALALLLFGAATWRARRNDSSAAGTAARSESGAAAPPPPPAT